MNCRKLSTIVYVTMMIASISYGRPYKYRSCHDVTGLTFDDFVTLARPDSIVGIPCDAHTVMRHTNHGFDSSIIVRNSTVVYNQRCRTVMFQGMLYILYFNKSTDQGAYRCIHDEISSCKYVIDEDQFNANTYHGSVLTGTNVQLTCASVHDNRKLGKYAWWVFIDRSNMLRRITSPHLTRKTTINITNIQPHQSGKYLCRNIHNEFHVHDIRVSNTILDDNDYM